LKVHALHALHHANIAFIGKNPKFKFVSKPRTPKWQYSHIGMYANFGFIKILFCFKSGLIAKIFSQGFQRYVIYNFPSIFGAPNACKNKRKKGKKKRETGRPKERDPRRRGISQ
jgi:hypothetical protein